MNIIPTNSKSRFIAIVSSSSSNFNYIQYPAGGIIGIGSTDSAKIIEISSDVGVSISLGLEIDLKSNQRPLVDLILGASLPFSIKCVVGIKKEITVRELQQVLGEVFYNFLFQLFFC